jgi:hypothetical protein
MGIEPSAGSLPSVAEVEGVAGCGDVKRGAVLVIVEHATLLAIFPLRAERVGRACVRDVQLPAALPADEDRLPAVKRCLPDLRHKRGSILGQIVGKVTKGKAVMLDAGTLSHRPPA